MIARSDKDREHGRWRFGIDTRGGRPAVRAEVPGIAYLHSRY